MKNLFKKIKQLAKEGLFHIFGSSVIAKVGGIISSVVVIRNLPKAAYGSYVDAENLYAYAAIFIQGRQRGRSAGGFPRHGRGTGR